MYDFFVSTELAQPCAVSFWCFAGPVILGNLAAFGAGKLASMALNGDSDTTKRTAATIAGMAAFWLIGGLTWVALAKRKSPT